jgi:hypothetical protein
VSNIHRRKGLKGKTLDKIIQEMLLTGNVKGAECSIHNFPSISIFKKLGRGRRPRAKSQESSASEAESLDEEEAEDMRSPVHPAHATPADRKRLAKSARKKPVKSEEEDEDDGEPKLRRPAARPPKQTGRRIVMPSTDSEEDDDFEERPRKTRSK